jgi:AcrR family transcriptional regulator
MSPRAFSAEEKERVRERLIAAAERFLGSTGIRKTTVEDLAKAAGISKGAFYLFYESKEILFMDALDRAQQIIHDNMIERIRQCPNKREGFADVVTAMYRDFMSKPYLVALAGEEYEALLNRIPQERIAAHIAADDASSRRFCEELGASDDVSPELLSATLRMLFLGLLHRDEVGELADEAFEFSLRALADKLFKEEA